MFTGIIEAVGEIKQAHAINDQDGNELMLHIAAGNLDLSDVKPGDSIAVNGVCLTVTALDKQQFSVTVSQETRHCAQGFEPGTQVNLEKAMRLSDRLGGHLVSGHVDATGVVKQFEPIGDCVELIVQVPQPLLRFITHKGSITVNGVSLTVNRIDGDRFSVNLIPHTLKMTNLRQLSSGALVNLETDMLARYVARLLNI